MAAPVRRPDRAPDGVVDYFREVLATVTIDFDPAHEHPALGRLVLATGLAVLGSLLADVILVALATAVFPSTRGFAHFRFSDYGTLTVVGVVLACLAWPIVSRISSAPRWLFYRLAILVILVLWLPDLWILIHGEPAPAVGALMLMHLAIAFITYPALVNVATIRARPEPLVGRSLPLLV
ncbi:MAG: hypothetical protein ACYDEA_13880 [Candidatus Dormibacteria bacterium]